MRLIAKPLQVEDMDGFDKSDLFGYSEFGGRLAHMFGSVEHSIVVALAGEWGSGNSTFVLQWAEVLRRAGTPVLYFDAFENDHYGDAFLALAALIDKDLLDKEKKRKKYPKNSSTKSRA